MATYQGTNGNDTRTGAMQELNEFRQFGIGADILKGGALRDIFRMSIDSVTDSIDGGDGRDLIDYSSAQRPLTIKLGNAGQGGSVTAGTVTVAKLSSIEDVIGSQYGDKITGNDAANLLDGRDGDDTLDGGKGDDTLIGGAGKDTLTGGEGSDTASYADAGVGMNIVLDASFSSPESGVQGGKAYQITASGFVHEDTFTGVENAIGSAYDDIIRGNAERNTLDGAGGNDRILTTVDGHDDLIIGGEGSDMIDYSGWVLAQDLEITLGESGAAGQTRVASANGSMVTEDKLFGIENVTGAAGDDLITGNNEANTLAGGAGDDTLIGGKGRDILLGGADNDTFVFTSAADSSATALDSIRDFARGSDKLDFRALANETADHQALNLITGPFTGEAGQVTATYYGVYSGWQVAADLDGDQAADFTVQVKVLGAPQAFVDSDFLF